MAPQHTQPAARPAGVVAVVLAEPGIAIVSLLGDHDLSTRRCLIEALAEASAQPNILVDLCGCTFMDSSVIVAMFVARKRLAERGGRLELVIPPEAGAVQRVASITSLASILPIHATRDAGLSNLRSVKHFKHVKDLRAAWTPQRRTPRSVTAVEAASLVD